MIGVDELVESVVGGSSWGLGVALAIGGALLVRAGARPVAKTAIKGYLALTETAREGTSGIAETFQDLYAEAKSDLQTSRQSSGN